MRHMGPYTSVGKANEIHGTSVQIEPEILKIFCPKGVTSATKRELMDAAPDILSLPSKLGSTTNDSAEVWDQFAGTVSEIAEQQTSRLGAAVRDTRWWVASRNALDKVKTMEDLFDVTNEIDSQSDKVLQSFHASVQEILYSQGWTPDDVNVFLEVGPVLGTDEAPKPRHLDLDHQYALW
jgi:hypothetical protein